MGGVCQRPRGHLRDRTLTRSFLEQLSKAATFLEAGRLARRGWWCSLPLHEFGNVRNRRLVAFPVLYSFPVTENLGDSLVGCRLPLSPAQSPPDWLLLSCQGPAVPRPLSLASRSLHRPHTAWRRDGGTESGVCPRSQDSSRVRCPQTSLFAPGGRGRKEGVKPAEIRTSQEKIHVASSRPLGEGRLSGRV